MSWIGVLSKIPLFLLSLSLALPIIQADTQDNWIRVSCSTQNGLSLDNLGLDFIVSENESILLIGSTQFEAVGSQPILQIEVDSYGREPSAGPANVTCDVIFFMRNNSRDYYFSPDSNWCYVANATIENGIAKYQIGFSNDVERAKNILSKNGTLADYGVKGRVTFEITIGNSIGIIGQKRFFRIMLQTIADLPVIPCSVIVPQVADLKEAKVGNQEMRRRVPYWVYTSFSLTPKEQFDTNLYLEWNMPEQIPFVNRIIYDPIFLMVVSLIAGSLIGRYPWVWIDRRRQKRQFAQKLIAELEGIRRDIHKYKHTSTGIYDSMSSQLALFNEKTAEIVCKTYEEIKHTETIGYPAMSFEGKESPLQHEIEKISRNIGAAIVVLKKETSIRVKRHKKAHVQPLS
jgi:hypothetical protein